MAKKTSRSATKGPALRQRRSGASTASAEASAKRATASGKKINPITGARQPKQPPRKLAVGNCANCGCSQMDTCLWRTHPSPDAEGGKVKLCNACGIHIRDKGYNRKVTPEMLQRQSSQAQATRRAWAIQNGGVSEAESDSDGTPAPLSPASSSFSDAGDAPPSPSSSKAATPHKPTHNTILRKNSLKASPKASPKSKTSQAGGSRKAGSAGATSKASRPAPLKLTKSAFDTSVKVVQVPSPTSDAPEQGAQRKKEVSIRPKPPAMENEAPMSDEDAADAFFRLVNAAWRQYDSCSEAEASSSCCASSDAGGSESFHSGPRYTVQAMPPAPMFRGDVYYPTPGPEKSFHSFSSYQSSHSWSDDSSSPAPYSRRHSVESVNIITPPVTPVLCASNGYVPRTDGKVYQPDPYACPTGIMSEHLFNQ